MHLVGVCPITNEKYIEEMKDYYNLREVGELVDIKERQLKNRMIKVKQKYKDDNRLLRRASREWRIHKSIVFEFDRIRVSKSEREKMLNTLVTISPDGHYDVDYLVELVNKLYTEINKESPVEVIIQYFIEEGELGGRNHIHFASNLSTNYTAKIKRHANYYTKCNIDVRNIFDVLQLVEYLKKGVKVQGKLPKCTVNSQVNLIRH